MELECFIFRSVFNDLIGKDSTVLSLRTRREASPRLYKDDDGSGRMIKVKIEEI